MSLLGCVSPSRTCDPHATDCLTVDHLVYARMFCNCLDRCLRMDHATDPTESIYKFVCVAHQVYRTRGLEPNLEVYACQYSVVVVALGEAVEQK